MPRIVFLVQHTWCCLIFMHWEWTLDQLARLISSKTYIWLNHLNDIYLGFEFTQINLILFLFRRSIADLPIEHLNTFYERGIEHINVYLIQPSNHVMMDGIVLCCCLVMLEFLIELNVHSLISYHWSEFWISKRSKDLSLHYVVIATNTFIVISPVHCLVLDVFVWSSGGVADYCVNTCSPFNRWALMYSLTSIHRPKILIE